MNRFSRLQEVVPCGVRGHLGFFLIIPPNYGTVAFRTGTEKRDPFNEKNYQNILN